MAFNMSSAMFHSKSRWLLSGLYVLTCLGTAFADEPSRSTQAWGNKDETKPRVLGMTLAEQQSSPEALLVEAVAPNSAADQAGIRVSDLVLKLGSQKVIPVDDLLRFAVKLVESKPTAGIPVELVRRGQHHTLSISLQPKASPQQENASGPESPVALQPPPGQASIIVGLVLRQLDRQTVIIGDVAPGSPAAEAGLQGSDVILALDGVDIKTAEQFAALLGTYRIADQPELQIRRGGQTSLVKLSILPRLMDLTVLSVRQAIVVTEPQLDAKQREIEALERKIQAIENAMLFGTRRP
jgi:C-terminal processing protease CtpA/Prc